MEILGASPNIFQASNLVADTIVNCTRLWLQVQDAPADLEALVIQLAQYAPVFRSIGAQISSGDLEQQSCDDFPIHMVLKSTKAFSDRLFSLVEKSRIRVGQKSKLRGKAAALMFVLGKDDRKELQEKLNQSLTLLQLAYAVWNG